MSSFDDESPDAAELDLTPRPVPAAVAAKRKRRWGAIVALIAVLGVGGVVVTKFLTEAIDYACDVDELGHKSGCAAGNRLRLQGEVKEGTKKIVNGVTTFVLTKDGVDLPVHYDGVPSSEIFQDCVNVVVHGQLIDGVFEGDNVTVKHSNTYEAADAAGISKERSAACQLQR